MSENTRIKAVIFDLGGVIVRTESGKPREALAQRLGISRWDLEDAVFGNPVAQKAESGQATQDEAWIEAARILNLPEAEIPALRREFFSGDVVDYELIELIQRLRPAYTTAALSNTWVVDLPAFMRDNLQIPDTFDIIISSAQCGLAKPNPAIFRLALEAVQARPEETVFVDDNEKNFQVAAAMGIRAIRFRSAVQAREELLALVTIPD